LAQAPEPQANPANPLDGAPGVSENHPQSLLQALFVERAKHLGQALAGFVSSWLKGLFAAPPFQF
jgi:hypothetical protein